MEGMKEPTQDKVCLYFSMFLTLDFNRPNFKFQTILLLFFVSFYGECLSHSDSP